jgi:hypothetical protein
LSAASPAWATTDTFTYTGSEQTFTVPNGVHSVQVIAVGGHGGRGGLDPVGGVAAQVSGFLSVSPEETLYVEVGGNGANHAAGSHEMVAGGFNGGGSGGGGGGGASDVRTAPRAAGLSPDDRLLVARGGGGGGVSGWIPGGFGGAAGEAGYEDGAGSPHFGEGGGAGTQIGGGSGGGSGGCQGAPGALGVGGSAALGGCEFLGGGGGGGFYGGGGGASGGKNAGGSGGGGGSSLIPAGGTLTLTTRSEYNVYTPEPQVQITYSSASATFTRQATLSASDELGKSLLGSAVALSRDGNIAVAGGPSDNGGIGAAWVFVRRGAKWTEQAKLTGPGEVGSAEFGTSVSLSSDGKTALIGAPADNNGIGAAWVFTRKGSSWTQQGEKLTGRDAGGSQEESHCDRERGFEFCFVGHPAGFGTSVALSSDSKTAVIGGPGDNRDDGAAWVFTRKGSTWEQQGEKLTGAGEENLAEPHATHFLIHFGGRFGTSVALSSAGNTALIGGPQDDSSGGGFGGWHSPGSAWAFRRSGSTWTQQGERLKGVGATQFSLEGTQFGTAVALSGNGNTALIGGPGDGYQCDECGRGLRSGSAWVYTRSGSAWTQQGEKLFNQEAPPKGEFEYLGAGVALSADGNTALLGGLGGGLGQTGRVFTRSDAIWTQQPPPLMCAGLESPGRGCRVALSGDASTALVGTAVYVDTPHHG